MQRLCPSSIDGHGVLFALSAANVPALGLGLGAEVMAKRFIIWGRAAPTLTQFPKILYGAFGALSYALSRRCLVPLDQFHAHEALDRKSLICDLIQTHLLGHPWFEAHPDAQAQVAAAQRILLQVDITPDPAEGLGLP
jgi:hypothetical protein